MKALSLFLTADISSQAWIAYYYGMMTLYDVHYCVIVTPYDVINLNQHRMR